jgi:hypothetical protein
VNAKSERCSPTDAANILRPAFKDVVAAAAKLTQATHAGLNLYVNGEKVHPAFLPHILVVGECQPDGKWTARVTSTVKIGGIGPSDRCEFETDQIKALLPQPELERPWPIVSGSVNWTPPAMLAPKREAEPRNPKRRKRRRKPKPSEPEKVKPPEPQPPARRNEPREYEEIRQFAARKWPRGYEHIATRDIIATANLDEEFKEKVDPFPSRYQFERALGRRK